MPEAFCGLEIVRKCVLLNLWVLWEIILPSDLLGCHLIARVRTFSYRITQMNRTHSISQSPCGRQNSQNLTANISWNALCSLYAGGVLWARNVRQKTPWTLCALWENKLPKDWYVCSDASMKPASFELKMTKKKKRVCQNVHILFFMHKAPTFSSQGFAIS